MLRKIMAAIAAAIRFVAKTVWVPMQVAGRLALMPFTVLEKVFGGGGGGSPEAEAADQAAQQAQASQQKAEKAMTAGDHSANLRGVARRRAYGKDVDPAMLKRLPEPLAAYVQALSLPECEALAKARLADIGDVLEGRLDRIDGVRTPAEVADAMEKKAAATKPVRALHPDHAALSGAFQASLGDTLARARGNACAFREGNASIPTGKVEPCGEAPVRVM